MALKKLQAGFTLIEMLVVVAIIGVVSSILLFNYSDFSTDVSVRNLAQEVALSVRKAQTYATSVRTIEGTSLDSKTFPAYGISFATYTQPAGSTDIATPYSRQFIIFADASVDPSDPTAGVYNPGTDNKCGKPDPNDEENGECLESISINTADKVESICATYANGSTDCPSEAQLDVSFRRPSPDAVLCLTTKNGVDCSSISYATVNLVSAKGLKRAVQIWTTGQISVL